MNNRFSNSQPRRSSGAGSKSRDAGSGMRSDRTSSEGRSTSYRGTRTTEERGSGFTTRRGTSARPTRDDWGGAKRDDRGGARRDDRGGARRDDRGGARRDDRGGARRDDRGGARRDDRGGARRDENARETAPLEYIIGRRSIMEAIRSKRPINKLLVQDGLISGSIGEIIDEVKAQGAFVQTVSRAKLDDLSHKGVHQGLLAYIAAKEYAELEDIVERAKAKKPGIILVLDGIIDPQNFGAILRSADGAGAAGVIIPKRRAVPLTGSVGKASAGAIEHVPVARVANLSQTIQELKAQGFWIIGADASAKEHYWQMDLTGPIVYVIGSEGSGMSRLVAEHCDFLVKLPMRGELNSLNAGVAAAVLLYEAVRQRSI